MIDSTPQDLFSKLKGQFKNLTLGREDGSQTLVPSEAVFFEFDFSADGERLGSVVVSIVDTGILKVYFSNDITDNVNIKLKNKWYDFLKGLSKFSARNMLNYQTKNISKARLDKKDFAFLSKQNKTEEELTMESKLYGSKQKSYQDLNDAKLIVQHNRTVDEDKMGARSRNIKAIYIENSQGERFKFENNYLPGARAMARHVSNGGYPRDEHGMHIGEIMSEMSQLKTFVRGVKSQNYVNEDAQDIIERATGRYYGLKNTLESISKQKGYVNYFEAYQPSDIEVSEDDINDLKAKLTRNVFDDKLQDSLSVVGKAMKITEKKQGEFFDYGKWVRSATSAGAEVVGDVNSATAMKDGEEIGSWSQDAQDLEAKYGSDVKEPGYGEVNMGMGDRSDTPERPFDLPEKLELAPGENILKNVKYRSSNDLLNLILVDIGERATDDGVKTFAEVMAEKIGSIGSVFGQQEEDPEFKANKGKAVKLAGMYIKQMKDKKESLENNVLTTVENTSGERHVVEVPMEHFKVYESSMDRLVEGTWNLPGDQDTVQKVIDLMQKPIPLGDGGEGATDAISFAFGDDTLYDELGDAGDKNPKADARPIILNWIESSIDNFADSNFPTMYLDMIFDELTYGQDSAMSPAQGELPLDVPMDNLKKESAIQEGFVSPESKLVHEMSQDDNAFDVIYQASGNDDQVGKYIQEQMEEVAQNQFGGVIGENIEAIIDEIIEDHYEMNESSQKFNVDLDEDPEEITNTGREEDLSNIDRDSVTLDMVKPAIEKMLASYEADANEWNNAYTELEKEVRAKGVTDPKQIQTDVFNMDDDIVSYTNIDDLEDKIDAIKRLMKQGDADGNDIVDLASSGPSDTIAREDFMQELKYAIKQDHSELYSKLFMYDIGESMDESVNEAEIQEDHMKGYQNYKCKDCGDTMHSPTTSCSHESSDESGDWWIDKNGNGVKDMNEEYGGDGVKVMFKGREIDTGTIDYDMEDFSDLIFNIDYGVRYTDGSLVDEADYGDLTYTDDIMDFVRIDYVESFREGVDNMPTEGNKFSGELEDARNKGEDEFEVDGKKYKVTKEDAQIAQELQKLKEMAGIGSGAKSNFGIYPGEEGYKITPRSLVAREMNKLRDIENKK